MKELSIEQKAKAYDEALERAKNFADNGYVSQNFVSDIFFPELAESEDERIRKAIFKALSKKDARGVLSECGVDVSDALAWLEKQSNTNETINRDEFAQGVLRGAAINLITWIDYNSAEGNMCLSNMECKGIEDALVSGDWDKIYAYMKKKLEKQDEQNPVDKIEPKFKVGDWVVFNNKHQSIYKVEKIEDGYYILRHTHGGTFRVCVLHDESLRLWTIQDARDGDVLVCESGERTLECLFIFKLIADREVHEYCSYRTIDKHFSLKDSFLGYVDNVYHPATKEQRDTLEKAMVDAGYTFNFEKKELKKIEQNLTWSEDDEKMLNSFLRKLEVCDLLSNKEITWIKDKLKSLKERYTWKPSDEQMNALHDAAIYIDNSMFPYKKGFLMKLYKQLKKLREK